MSLENKNSQKKFPTFDVDRYTPKYYGIARSEIFEVSKYKYSQEKELSSWSSEKLTKSSRTARKCVKNSK